jgi:hypothetical protein
MFSRKHVMAGLLAGLALAGSAAAFAQPAPKPETGQQAERRQAMMQRMCAEMPARLAGRLAYAEVKLGITDQQKGAWQTFSQDARTALQPLQKQCAERAAAPRPASPPDAVTQLADREKMLGAMLDATRGMRQAVEKLTPSLTDEQKKQVAEIVGRMGRHGPRMHGHRMMRHHGHGPGGDHNAPAHTPGGHSR